MTDSATQPQDDKLNVFELPFDQYQRFRRIQEVIESIRWNPHLSILDVSKSPTLLEAFLPDDNVEVADIANQPDAEFSNNSLTLAFEDLAFDIVVTSDALPSVSQDQRHNFLAELTRVAREAVIVSAPFDDIAVIQAEDVFRSLIWARYGEGVDFLEARRRYGLPNVEDTLASFHEKGLQTTVLPNGYLHSWLIAISTFYLLQWRLDDASLNARANTYYNSNFYKWDNREPSYRKILVATRTQNVADLPAQLCSEDSNLDNDRLFHLQILNLFVQTLTEAWSSRALEKERTVQLLNAQLAEKRGEVEPLVAQVSERQRAVDRLAAQVAERHEKVISLTELVADRQSAVDSLSAQLIEMHEKVRTLTASLAEQREKS